jgi:hypothetical protein
MNKLILNACILTIMPLLASAAPLRVALLDFEDETGSKPDAATAGVVNTATLAKKGVDLMSKQLIDQKGYTLIDRRDFIAKLQQASPREVMEGQPRPAFIQAGQMLGASAVLGGSLSSFSTSREKYNLGGNKTELTKLSMRVTIRALDVVDGSVIAVADGVAEQSFRQTESVQTTLGEEDILTLMESAIAKTIPKLNAALNKHQGAGQRPKATLNIDATENPALVEIDGILVGTTPVLGLEVYQGDHTLTVSRPGYVTMAKRIVVDRKFQITVPMLRTDLTVEERKQILDKAQMKVFLTNGKPDILIQTLTD